MPGKFTTDPPAETRRKPKNTVLLGFAYRTRGPKGRWTVKFRWGRILITLGILTVLGYASVASLLYAFFKYKKNYDEAGYWQMYAFPFRMQAHFRDMGEYQIQKAKAILKDPELEPQKKFRGAYQSLRAGVLNSPSNLEGRRMLAEMIIFVVKNQDMGMKVLQQGIPYAYDDFTYLQFYLRVLFNFKKDAEIVELADRILATEPDDKIEMLLAIAAATALQKRGNFDRAEDYIETHAIDRELEGMLLSAQISWERGQKRAAIDKLNSSIAKFTNKESIYARLSQYYRDLGEFDNARATTVNRIANAPLSIAPKIDLLHILRSTGKEARADREAETILEQFKTSESSLLSLANYAAEFGLISLFQNIYNHALEANYDIAPFALMLIETYIKNENFDEAVNFSEKLIEESPEWLDQNWAIFNSLRSIAHFGQGNKDLSAIYLNQFLKEANVRVESLMAVSKAFQQLGAKSEARSVLLQAYSDNPDNQAALSSLIRLDIELGNSENLGNYLKQLLKMRRPSVDILDEAYRKLSSDRFIFTQDRDALLIELNAILNPS